MLLLGDKNFIWVLSLPGHINTLGRLLTGAMNKITFNRTGPAAIIYSDYGTLKKSKSILKKYNV